MPDYLSEAVAVRMATEAVRGVAPGVGAWTLFQVDVGALPGWRRNTTDVERDIFSVNATLEVGDHVAYDVNPEFSHDCNKDFLDQIGEAAFRCNAKHFGSTSFSKFRPTAVVDGGGGDDSFTVAASGNLAANHLIKGNGFTNAANNALLVTVVSADPLAVKVGTGQLVAETPPANATLDVVGIQGVANDIGINASGHLTSAGGVFAGFNPRPGSWIYLPSQAEATAMGNVLYAFTTAANTGFARIVAVTPTLITLERHTFAFVADPGTGAGEIIRVFVGSRFYRNYPIDDITNYNEKTLSAEKTDVKPSVAADTRYTYVLGCGVNTLSIAAALESKMTATLGLTGMTADLPVPVANRKTGPSTAFDPLVVALHDTQNDLEKVRLTDTGGDLVNQVTSWTFNLTNNIKPKKVQGTYGAADLNFGKFDYRVPITAYYNDSDVMNASDENRQLAFDMITRNHQFCFVLDMPNSRLRNPDLQYAGSEPVMLEGEVIGFRSTVDGIAGSLSVFGYLPTV